MNAVLESQYRTAYRPPAELTLWAAALVALAVFAIDAFTAFDIAVAVFYVVVVLLVASTGSRGYVLAAAVGVAVLTVIGFLFSHWSNYALGAIGRCVVSLLAIGTTSILSLRHLANTTQLQEQINLLNLTHDAIIVYDMGGAIMFWNHGAEALYGWTAKEAAGRHFHELTQTRSPVPQEQIYRTLLDSGHWSGELQRTCRDGRAVTVASRIAVWRDAKGEPRAILATNNDITLQRRMEEAIKQQQEELRAAVDTIPGMVWSATNEGEVVFVNRRWEEAGFDTKAADGADLWQGLVHPDDLAQMRRDWHASVSTGQSLDNVSRVRQRDGQYRWMHIAAEPQRDAEGVVRRWYGVNTDIEARKRAEDALTRSEAFLVDAQRLSKTGSIGITSASGGMIWSSEAYRIFGYEEDPSIVPSLELILARTHADDRARVEVAHRRDALEPLIDLEYRLAMPDGALKYVHYVAHLGPPASTNLIYVGALMDVTDARRTQEALARSTEELAHVTRMTTLGELAASIAHEVTQPMAAVVTSGDAALRWLNRAQPNVEEAAHSIGQMIKAARRANDIVRHIRSMAQKRASARELVSLDAVVDEAIQFMTREFERHSVRCNLRTTQAKPVVHADAVQLQQVVINLLMNAIQAIVEHGCEPRQVAISTEVDADAAHLCVQDSGPGISEENLAQLFTPFFTTKPGGMGMGLSICRSIVEGHGGRISVATPSGAGALFRISLPLQTAVKENA